MYDFFMTNKLANYLKSLKGHDLNTLSGNQNGVLEMSIDLRKELKNLEDEGSSAYFIHNSKTVIMLNKWQLTMNNEVKADNTTSYPEVEYFLADTIKPEKIVDVIVDDNLERIEFITSAYKVVSDMSQRVLIHDFDFKTTLALEDGKIEIVSKEKNFPFVD